MKDQKLLDELNLWNNSLGTIGAPFDSYMTLRGLRTLELRIHRSQENAGKLANFLNTHKAVEKVYYPGLPSHPGYEIAKRQQEEARRIALEKALAIPLASGRVTLDNGRIGISGSVLFDFNSDQLRPEGEQLLKALVPPLQVYLGERDEMLMVSGFTDNKTVVKGPSQRYADNLELSAQRALTVTRALIADGMPRSRVFSAAFGAEQPVASNDDERGRALNRRVEMAPVPRSHSAPPATK